MTDRFPPLQTRSLRELAKAQIASVYGFKNRHTRLISGATQEIPDATDTVVQFGGSKVVAYDDIGVDAVWDGTAHAWDIPADASLVRLHGEIRFGVSAAGGDTRGWIRHEPSGDTFGLVAVNRVTALAALTIVTPVLLASPGDQFSLHVYQATGNAENVSAACSFTLEIAET